DAAKMLMPPHVAADAIASEQRLAAKERIPGAFEIHSFRQVFNREPVGSEPGVEVRRLTGADLVTKSGAEEALFADQAGVRREDRVRQLGRGRHKLDGYAQAPKNFNQTLPLATRCLRRAAPGAAHPRIDFVFDAVVVRWTHQDARMAHVSPWSRPP